MSELLCLGISHKTAPVALRERVAMGETEAERFAREAVAAPAIDEAGKYVAGAYLVFLALVLIYVAVMAVRQARLQKEIDELAALVEARLDRDEAKVPVA